MEGKRPIAIDLFSGAGGMSLGLEAGGFDIAAAVEIDPIHAATHHFNFPYSKTICTDIRDLHPGKLALADEIDLICFGSPCQAFSPIGRQDPKDPRANLSLEALRIILSLRPKYFVMENVPAIANSKNLHILKKLIKKFKAGGYKVVKPIQILNAKNFGVPQNRDRLFMLGYREDCIAPKYPIGSEDTPQVIDHILDLQGITPFTGTDYGIDAQILRNHKALSGTRIKNQFAKCYPRQGQDTIWGHLGSKHSGKVRDRFLHTPQGKKELVSRFHKLDPSGLCNTLRAGTPSDKGSHTAPRPIHYSQTRCVTIREAARLHGYPDWFQFHRKIWHGHRQIGNSVCPPVAKAIAEEIAKCLNLCPQRKLREANDQVLSFNRSTATRYFHAKPAKNEEKGKKTHESPAIALK